MLQAVTEHWLLFTHLVLVFLGVLGWRVYKWLMREMDWRVPDTHLDPHRPVCAPHAPRIPVRPLI